MSKERKREQLGMDAGTAAHQLKKLILFKLVQETKQDVCFRCGERIESADVLSVEHKIPWLDSSNPKELFFDLENIAFSHLICNTKDCRKTNQKYFDEESKRNARRESWRRSQKKIYSPEKRRDKYDRNGY